MAAPGTITHVLEVAQQLAAAAGAHAASLQDAASAAAPGEPAAAEAPLKI
jgi:hypothetical protein